MKKIKIDELISAIQSVKLLAMKTMATRPRAFRALEKAEEEAGWELADLLTKKKKEKENKIKSKSKVHYVTIRNRAFAACGIWTTGWTAVRTFRKSKVTCKNCIRVLKG